MKIFLGKKSLITFIAILISIFLNISFVFAVETPEPQTPEVLQHETPSVIEDTTTEILPHESPNVIEDTTTTPSASPSATSEALSTSETQLQTINTNGWPTLKDALDPNKKGGGTTAWIFTIWNVCLGLVNIVVAGILIFLAFVNILRIQIDTYALKKILPTLIIAVILANFSMLICRMIIDFSDALTKTFAADPEQLAEDLQASMGLVNATGASGLGVAGFAVVSIFISPAITLIGLLIAFILGVIPGIGILILAFLLFIRTGVIYALVAVSPLAFICMALPATQGLFRQWWSQFARWIFMAPIVFFLLKIASMVSSTQFSIWSYVVSLGMLYLAIQVPFKMGGVIMGIWGGLGKRLGGAGLKHGLRTADSAFGEAMKKRFGREISPFGLYEGWKKGSEMNWQKHLAASTGAGMEIREGVTGLNERVPRMVGEAWKTKSLGKIGEVWAPSLSAQVMAQEAELKPHMEKARQLQHLDEKSLDNAYESAIKNNNESEARDILLAKSMKGNAKNGDFLEYAKKFDNVAKKTNGAEVSAITYALINQTSVASRGTINPLANPYDLDNKKRRGVASDFQSAAQKELKNLTDQYDSFAKGGDANKGKMTQMINRSLGFVEKVSRADYQPDNEAHLRFLRQIVQNNDPILKDITNSANIIAQVNSRPDIKTRFNEKLFGDNLTKEVQDTLNNIMYNPINLNVPVGAKAEYILKNIDVSTGKVKNDVMDALIKGYRNLDTKLKEKAGIQSVVPLTTKKRIDIINTLDANIKNDFKDKHEILQRMEKGINDMAEISGGGKVNGINDLINKYKKKRGA